MLAMYVVLAPTLLLFCGLALDSGMLELKKIQMQSAADAAAIGAELEFERNTGNWVTMAQADAAVNGFTNGTNNVTVAVQQQPTSGPYANRYDALQVTISQKVQTVFMGAIHGGQVTLTASAVSLVPPCGFAMNTSGSGSGMALTQTNVTSSCPLYVNPQLSVDATSWLKATAINVTGSSSSDLGQNNPAPRYSSPTVTDPLGGITEPAPASACTVLPNTTGGGTLITVNLTPGTYCGPNNGPVSWAQVNAVFSAGTYIFEGGLSVSDSMMQGSGVTLYFTKNSVGTFGQVSLRGNSSILISAPTSSTNGGVPGVLWFFDRQWTTTATDFQCNDALLAGSGIIYGIKSGFTFANCSIWPETFNGFVANTFSFNSTVYQDTFGINITGNYSNISGGSPFRSQSVLVQ